jgi:hypothetical protein
VARTDLPMCCGTCAVAGQTCNAEGRCVCPMGQVVCGNKCIPRDGCCVTCSGNRVCNDQNVCVCPQARECGTLCCPEGQRCLTGPMGGMRCGTPDPMTPPGGLPP